MLLAYAAEQGWEVYGIYSDDDYTGSDRNRPAFQRLLADAEAHRFDIILCKTQSRFTRELELVEKYIHGLFPVWGIRFIGLADNADTDNKGNKKSRQINGLGNEWYLEDMSENIRSVLTNRRQNGYHIGAFAAYGYKKDPEQKGRLLIDAEGSDKRYNFCLASADPDCAQLAVAESPIDALSLATLVKRGGGGDWRDYSYLSLGGSGSSRHGNDYLISGSNPSNSGESKNSASVISRPSHIFLMVRIFGSLLLP